MESHIYKIFSSNKKLIANILRKYSINALDIEDLTQETIVRALEAEKRTVIREPRRFLIGIAKNVARAELERRSKIMVSLLDDFYPETYVSNEPTVDIVVDGRQRIQVFWRAVMTLPPQCQKVFILKHVYGASHKEISKKLNISVSTVEKHVALGLKRCREKMLKQFSLGDDKEVTSVIGLNTHGVSKRGKNAST